MKKSPTNPKLMPTSVSTSAQISTTQGLRASVSFRPKIRTGMSDHHEAIDHLHHPNGKETGFSDSTKEWFDGKRNPIKRSFRHD